MPSLEFFWGVEVKPGQTVSCDPGKECILRLSQAALDETKKGSVPIVVSAKVDDQKVIIGTLSAKNRPQLSCDLIFHKEIELSHNSKTASVFLCGYRAVMPDMPGSDSSKDEGALMSSKDEGEVKTVNNRVIKDDSDLSSSDDDLTEDDSSSENDTSEEDDNSSEEDDGSSEASYSSSEEIATSSEEDSSDEEDKNTPKKPEDGKKRVATTLKTPASDKKAKITIPSGQTTGDKKVPHVATPASKAPGNSDSKPKAESSKSSRTYACKSCSKLFRSDAALQAHGKTHA